MINAENRSGYLYLSETTIPIENVLYPAIMRYNIGIVSTVYADETSCHTGAYGTPLIWLHLTLVRTSTRLPQSRKPEKFPRLRLLARQIFRPSASSAALRPKGATPLTAVPENDHRNHIEE